MKYKLFWALREVFVQGYTRKNLLQDVQAGVVVGIVALPLAMALAIASGVAPQNGIYTVIVGGAVIAILGGSRFQVSGPTAAFVVLLLPVVQKFGLSGLLIAGLISGVLCVTYGLLGLGDVIQFVPHPVTTGFTTGIALVIATLQFKDFFGLPVDTLSSDFLERSFQIASAIPNINLRELGIGAVTLAALIFAHKKVTKVPAPIFALGFVTLGVVLLDRFTGGFSVANIATRFSYQLNGETLSGIPRTLPLFSVPSFDLTWLHVKEIFPSAFAISLLGAIESLLSAVVADGMTMQRHNPNAELVAIGVGNILCPFFGGIPATGAIARTTTNIRFGAHSPLAAAFHSLTVLIILISLAPVVSYIPMASLAALLLFVAWNMAERHNFANILRIGGFDDRFVLLTCFGLTVMFDMTIGVAAGIVLSSTLFIRRMALSTQSELEQIQAEGNEHLPTIPQDVLYYRIKGNLFFGGAQRAMERFSSFTSPVHKVIFDLSDVTFIDITGLVAFDSAVRRALKMGLKVAVIAPKVSIQKELMKLDAFQADGAKLIK